MTLAHDAVTHWSGVAPAWDREVDEIDEHSWPATSRLFEQLGVGAGERVLELAAGPGSLAAAWSAQVGPTGRVVLSDVAPGMVEVARRRAAGLDNVTVAIIDASAIDRPDRSFDAVACRMGLMFAPDPALAFAEIHRVLDEGGRLGALTWGALEHNPWMTCVGMAAMMHGVVSGGPPVGPGGIFSLSDSAQLQRLAADAGFVAVSVEAIDITFEAPSIGAHIQRVGSLAGPLASALDAASAEQRAAVHDSAADLAAPYIADDGVAIPGRALLLTGRS
jgi:SAM-dependent methyltransferase